MYSQEQIQQLNKLNSIVKEISSEYYVETIFDYVQTHAVKGIRAEDVELVKDHMKEHKANRFRVVKNRYGYAVLCFKANKMAL